MAAEVGAVAAREASRFALNSRDWQQLIEMCRVVDRVLIDQETIQAAPCVRKAQSVDSSAKAWIFPRRTYPCRTGRSVSLCPSLV
jgi:hypothetical protein